MKDELKIQLFNLRILSKFFSSFQTPQQTQRELQTIHTKRRQMNRPKKEGRVQGRINVLMGSILQTVLIRYT